MNKRQSTIHQLALWSIYKNIFSECVGFRLRKFARAWLSYF